MTKPVNSTKVITFTNSSSTVPSVIPAINVTKAPSTGMLVATIAENRS